MKLFLLWGVHFFEWKQAIVSGNPFPRCREEARLISTEATSILGNCTYFPSEFSLILTFKPSRIDSKNQYLLSVIPRNNKQIQLAIRLHWDSLYLDYITDDDVKSTLLRRKELTHIHAPDIHDGQWHTLIITISHDHIEMLLNCQKYDILGVQLPFPVQLHLLGSRFYIASRRRRKERYLGLLRQIKIGSGLDFATLCNEASPHFDVHLAEERRPKYIKPAIASVVFESDGNMVCSANSRGNLLYGTDKRLSLCDGAGWLPVTTGIEQVNYIEDWEDIYSNANTSDIEVFHIKGEGHFMATADSGNTSIIWKWDPEEEQYNLFQNISTNNAFHWKYFVIDNRSFLVVANFGGNKSGKTYSNVYRWHPKKRRFIVRQHMITHGARSWEHFEISGDNFLVVANSADPIGKGDSRRREPYMHDSKIWRWDRDNLMFGVSDWEYFNLKYSNQNGHYLACARYYDGRQYQIKSEVWKFQEHNRFFVRMPHLDLQTHGAKDIEFFTIDDPPRQFLAVANHGGDPVTKEFENSTIIIKNQIPSTIYEFNLHRSSFEELQKIGPMSMDSPQSILYKWQGEELFVPVHYLPARTGEIAGLLATLLAQHGEARELCPLDDLVNVSNGNWSCELNGTSIQIEAGQSVVAETKCQVSCNDDHYIMRPGVANYIRCKGDGQWVMKNTLREVIQMQPITCYPGCRRQLLKTFDNGSWDCPLMDPEVDTIEKGLQCFAQCNEGFELTDPSRSVYVFKHFEKTCRCNTDNGRCHWTKLDLVPKCAAARTNRIINGVTAEQNSKPYMVKEENNVKVKFKYTTAAPFLSIPIGSLLPPIAEKAILPPANIDPIDSHVSTRTGLAQEVAQCEVCGWGNTEYPNFKPAEKLQCVKLPAIQNTVCNKSYRGAIHEDIMCIGLMEGGKDSCQGDSGGPAICDGRVHGIVMGGLYCAQKDFPGVYTRVSHYVEWIRDIIRKGK